MNVPDSSAWIEYFRGSPLKAMFRPIVQDLTTLIVPSIVIYEVHKWMLLDVGEDAAMTAKAMISIDALRRCFAIHSSHSTRYTFLHRIDIEWM